MIFPRPGDSFGGWILRCTIIFTLFFVVLSLLGDWANNPERKTPAPPRKEWTGYDPTRPASDISHRDYTNKVFYYRPKEDYVPSEAQQKQKEKEAAEKKKRQNYRDPTDEEILEYIRNNEGDFDIEEIYDKYRD